MTTDRLITAVSPRARHLPPDEWFPASAPVATARMLELEGADRVRVVEAGPREGQAVVLLHGWGASAYSFRSMLPLLASAGFRAVAPDLRGHGLSEKPLALDAYSAEAMARQVLRVMDALNIPSAILVGQSMGGAIAIDAANLAAARMRGVVLVAPIGLTAVRRITVARALRAARWMPHRLPRWGIALLLRRIYGEVRTYDERDVDEYWAPAQFPDFTRALFLLVNAFDWNRRPVEHYAALGTHLRVLLGEYDRLIAPARALDRTRTLAKGQVTIVPRGGHLLAEETPELVVEAVRQLAG